VTIEFDSYGDRHEFEPVGGVSVAPAHYQGHKSLAEMVSTHISAFRSLISRAHMDKGMDRAYVDHELFALKAIDEACNIDLAAKAPSPIDAYMSASQDIQGGDYVELGVGQIADIWNGMPGGHEGFLKEWGYMQFSRALEEAFHKAQTKKEPQ
jgi:hypothetical protein